MTKFLGSWHFRFGHKKKYRPTPLKDNKHIPCKCKSACQGHPNDRNTYFEFPSWVYNKIVKKNCWDRVGTPCYADFSFMTKSALVQLRGHLSRSAIKIPIIKRL